MTEAINIVGAGGLAKELIAYIQDEKPQRFTVNGVWANADFNNPAFQKFYRGEFADMDPATRKLPSLLAVADPKSKQIVLEQFASDMQWMTYIHPLATVSSFVSLGVGCVVTPNSVVAGDAILGDFVFINTGSAIGHDATIGSYTTMYPNTEVCGDCDIGEACVLGIGAFVLPEVKLEAGTKVAAGSIVWKSPGKAGILAGNPAELVKEFH